MVRLWRHSGLASLPRDYSGEGVGVSHAALFAGQSVDFPRRGPAADAGRIPTRRGWNESAAHGGRLAPSSVGAAGG